MSSSHLIYVKDHFLADARYHLGVALLASERQGLFNAINLTGNDTVTFLCTKKNIFVIINVLTIIIIVNYVFSVKV